MKVLHLDTGQEWRGGQQQVLYLTRGLEELGIVSTVATPQGSPLAIRLRKQDLPVIELSPSSPFSPKGVRALQQILADRTWQVCHAHTAHAHTLMFLAFRLPPPRPFSRPKLVVARRVDFVPARDPVTRLKYTVGGQTFVCVSHAIHKILLDYGVPQGALYTVHSGVPLPGAPDPSDPLPSEMNPGVSEEERKDLRAELGVPECGFLIGSIGQFVEHKGYRVLLDALPKVLLAVPDCHLVLLGAGELEKDLRKQCEKLSLNPSVTFAGFRPDVARYLPAMDLFVSSSLEEGLGTSILDAQAARVPIVATRAGGICEGVNDGVTGILAPPGDAEALAAAIIRVLLDDKLRRLMGQAGRQWVGERFSTEQMVEGTLAVYREILGKT